MQVDLLYFPSPTQRSVQWSLGDCRALLDTPSTSAQVVNAWLETSTADYCLFWDMNLGLPEPAAIMAALQLPGDVWHAGLKLGMGGLPRLIDFVNPTWMLNRDADPHIVSSSWRLSFKACLIRTDILRQLGGLDPSFDTFDGAALDMGHRFITRGAFVRYVPSLMAHNPKVSEPDLTLYDELRFIRQQYGQKWVVWSIGRALLNGYSLLKLRRAYWRLSRETVRSLPEPYKRTDLRNEPFKQGNWHHKVTVLIPTLERYPYLRNELFQLRNQTIRPLEIIVVDQTPLVERDSGLAAEFSDLPLRVFYQDTMGQCTAWNEGLLASRGEYILFLGDDADRIAPDFLERFLRTFQNYSADMVASVVDEVGAGPPPFNCTFMRTSDIFPITMVKRELLEKSGLMDFAYDRAKRADGDLGMRCYCSGALMILNPEIRLLHHRAPRGGLRKHGVRVVTYASSKRSLTVRSLPSASECYLTLRHFSPRQAREELWLRIFSSLAIRGSRRRKFLKLLIGTFYLPGTLWQIRKRYLQAVEMLKEFPQIPTLAEPISHLEPDVPVHSAQGGDPSRKLEATLAPTAITF